MNGSTRKLKKNLKNSWKQMKMKTQLSKPLGCSKGGPKREVHSNTSPSQKLREVSNTQANLTPKGAGERTANKA